jgi:hypothetical protein
VARTRHELEAVEPDQPSRVTEPQVAIGILGDRPDVVARQPVLEGPSVTA